MRNQQQQYQGRPTQKVANYKTKGFTKNRSQDLIQAKNYIRHKKSNGDVSTKVGMKQLPPQWIDKVDEIKDNIVRINEICAQMEQLRIEKSRVVFTPTETIVSQKISDRVEHATSIMKECEDILARMGQVSWMESDEDNKMKLNAKMGLALGLQEVAQKLKIFQLEVIQDYSQAQKSTTTTNTNQYNNNTRSQTTYQYQNEQQIVIDNFEVEYLEQMASDRNDRIRGLGEKMQKLTELFKELNKLVIEQGTLLDRIDFNLETALVNTKKGKEELQEANQTSSLSNRASYCICLLVGLNVAFIGILVLKFTIFK